MAATVRIAMLGALVALLTPLGAPVAQQAQAPILAGPLAKLDTQNAQIEPGRGKPKAPLRSRCTSPSTRLARSARALLCHHAGQVRRFRP